MRTRIKLLASLAIVLMGVVAAPTAAQAAPPANRGVAIAAKVFDSTNPHAAYAALTQSDKALFDAAETPAAVSQTTTYTGLGANAGRTADSLAVTPNFSGCWAMQDSAHASALAGNWLYEFGQSTEVCVSGGRVNYVGVYNIWQQVDTVGWRYDHRNVHTFNAGWEGRGLVQWEFILGAGGWDIQHAYPCLQGRLNANGYSNLWNLSCNLS